MNHTYIYRMYIYRVFHWFRQAKFDIATAPATQKMKLASKVVKIDSNNLLANNNLNLWNSLYLTQSIILNS